MRLAEQLGLQVFSLGDFQVPREVLREISDTMAQMYKVVPVKLEDNTLTVATSEPQNFVDAGRTADLPGTRYSAGRPSRSSI
jgi:hypothetical protein